MKRLGIGVAGMGTVGGAVVRILQAHAEDIARRCGVSLEVAAICNRKGVAGAALPVGARHYSAWQDLVADDRVAIVVEAIGGCGVAFDLVRHALASGKPVVTANKRLMAEHGEALMKLAAQRQLPLGFEAAVAGGIPVIRAITEGAAGDRLRAVYGILNGTANYILSRMERESCSFEDALAEAQARGYAEMDPRLDVDGSDARDKLAILARLAFSARVETGEIATTGIQRVTATDMIYARRLDSVVRLVAAAELCAGGVAMSVRPWLVQRNSMLGKVEGVHNAVFVQGEQLGTQMFYGRGAGGEATGIGVLSDLMEIATDVATGRLGSKSIPGFRDPLPLAHCPAPPPVPWYLRTLIDDRPGVLAQIAGILAASDINVDSVLQEAHPDKRRLPFVILVEPVSEPVMLAAAAAINASGIVLEPLVLLRIGHSGEDG